MQPPHNPHGTPSPYESGQPGYTPSPTPSRGVSMDVIGEAWNILKPNIMSWVAALVVMYAIIGVFAGLMFFGFKIDPTTGEPSIGPLFFVALPLYAFACFALSAGLMKLAISTVRTGKTEIGEMFKFTDVLGNLFVASIIIGIAYSIGIVLCVIPGIIVIMASSMTSYLIIDQKMGAINAIKASWDKSKNHLGALFVLFLVLGLINFAGSLFCGIGVFVTFPLTQIALTLVYRDLFLGGNMGGNSSSGYNGPSAPIAAPR